MLDDPKDLPQSFQFGALHLPKFFFGRQGDWHGGKKIPPTFSHISPTSGGGSRTHVRELESQKLSIQRPLKVREGRKILPNMFPQSMLASRSGDLTPSGMTFLTSTALRGRKYLLSLS